MFKSFVLPLLLCAFTAQVFAQIDPNQLVNEEKMKPRGQRYESNVPDTLDLAEQARLALNNQVNNMEPTQAYCVYQVFTFGNPPVQGGLTWNLPVKNARGLPVLRVMCGSEQGLDTEAALMRTLLGQIKEDGLMYVPVENDGAPKDTAYPNASGMLIQAAKNWFERDGNPEWLKVIQTVGKALADIAIKVEDRAYYPPESGYQRGQWLWTMRGEATIPYRPPEEPYMEQQGLEGCVKYEQAAPLRGLVINHLLNQDAHCGEVAHKVKNFCLKPGLWEDTSAFGYQGHEHGVFAGHFHGNLTSLHALLDVANMENDSWLKQMLREAYEHGKRTGAIRLGWFPGMLRPSAMTWKEYGRDPKIFLASETCGVADMLVLAVKMTDSGLGDYWDDVDAIVRNHLTAQQITDFERMKQLGGAENEAILKRFWGGFNQSMEGWINSTAPHLWGCCSSNGAMGLYYAWHGITRFENGVARVNLFLNRASDWMDIDSYLPYEGRVVLYNKKASVAHVRLPFWLHKEQVKVTVNDKAIDPTLSENYLVIENLKAGDTIELKFNVPESKEKYTFGAEDPKEYEITLRGSTVIDVTPRDPNPALYQYYQRQEMKAAKASIRKVERFVADKIIPLQ